VHHGVLAFDLKDRDSVVSENTYCIPAAADVLSSVDSFAVVNSVLYIFQITDTQHTSMALTDVNSILKFVQPQHAIQDHVAVFIAPASRAVLFNGNYEQRICINSVVSGSDNTEVKWPQKFKQWIVTTTLDSSSNWLYSL
jgi:hypothetical protein